MKKNKKFKSFNPSFLIGATLTNCEIQYLVILRVETALQALINQLKSFWQFEED